MARTRTTKTLASRIELDYYRRPHPLRQWRARLAVGAFVAPLIALSGLVVAGRQQPWSPGPLAPAHASFEASCEECHAPGTGVDDRACSRCHAGTPHVRGEAVAAPACASCHREHGSNSRTADAHCTQCHATERSGVAAVASFTDHPEFALHRDARPDPGTIRLDHALHLALDLPGLARRLECADCHSLDTTGRRMAPIVYEHHCAGCHSLELNGELAGATVTHGLQPTALREELTRLASARVLRDTPQMVERSRRAALADPTVQAWLTTTVAQAEHFLAATRCAECHAVERGEDGGLQAIAPPGVPASWFAGARFDHQAHRATRCDECHHDVRSSHATSDLHLPRLADCAKCHQAQQSGGAARGDCLECHAYHGSREGMRDDARPR